MAGSSVEQVQSRPGCFSENAFCKHAELSVVHGHEVSPTVQTCKEHADETLLR